MKRQTAFASILILLTLVFTAISLKPAFFETTVAVAQTTQPAASGISPASPKDCIARNLPRGVAFDSSGVNTANRTVGITSSTRLSDSDTNNVVRAICACTTDLYTIRHSVTGEDPANNLIIIADCKSIKLAMALREILERSLLQGDRVRAIVKGRSVRYTGTVSKLATVEAASRAAIDAGAITVINNLKVRKQARK